MKPIFTYGGKPGGLPMQSVAAQAQAKLQQAWALHQQGQLTQALQLYEQVLQLQPKHFDALHLAGVVALQSGQPDKAIQWFDKALKVDRQHAGAYNNRGAAYQELKNFEQALLNYGKAISLKADYAEAYNNRGNVRARLNQFDEALADFDKAIALQSNYFEAYNNRGTTLNGLQRHAEAIASFERAVALQPQSSQAHWNLGMACLRTGDFERGWQHSEWRLAYWKERGRQDPYANQPRWTGAEPLQGKTILVHSEQGLGDTLQFSRYAPLLRERGAARVILEVQPPLIDVLKDLPGVDVVARDSALPPYDVYIPLLSLPMVFKTDLGNIPAQPDVVRSEPAKVAKWQAILGDKRKPRVGIVWSGNAAHVDDDRRSIPLQQFSQLLVDDIEWVSLHKEVRESDQAVLTATPAIRHFGDQLADFTDTAAICDLLDLVVCVDTSVAHLAATMGRPVWLLVAHSPDWRWLLDRQDSPWYPSVKLYRQHTAGDWQEVLNRIKADLPSKLGS